MKIGFYGDSFLMALNDPFAWTNILAKSFGADIIESGYPGASITQTLRDCENITEAPDIAVIGFTYIHRYYNERPYQQEFLRSTTINYKPFPEHEWKEFNQAFNGYVKWIWSEYETHLHYSLKVKWLMDLTHRYPNTKFVFLPITDIGQRYAREHHQQGLLLDFEFEAISNHEAGASSEMQVNDTRICHMSRENNIRFAHMIKQLIDGWEDHKNSIFPVNYGQFELKTLPAPRVYDK